MSISTLDQLDSLHDSYVEAVNEAVAADRPARVRKLTAAYDVDSSRLLGHAFGLSDSAPRHTTGTARVRRLVTRHRHAA